MSQPSRTRRVLRWFFVAALVVALALWVNDGAQSPRWITNGLIPVLGWIYLALAAYALGYWLWRKWRGPRDGEGD